jgi:hypothetical protein
MATEMVKIRLRNRTSAEKEGTILYHFGVAFTVQADSTLVATLDKETANLLVEPGRAELVNKFLNPASDAVPAQAKELLRPEEPDGALEVVDEKEMPNFESFTKDELVLYAAEKGFEVDKRTSLTRLVQTCEDIFLKAKEDKN